MGFHGLESKAGNLHLFWENIPYIFPISDSQLSIALVSNKCHSTPDEKHHIAVCKQEMRSAADDSVKTLEGGQH